MHVAFVLSLHHPFVRVAGPVPEGEETLHELINGTLLSLFKLVSDLRGSGLRVQFSLALSPILLEQLADPVVNKHCQMWFEERLALIQRVLAERERANDTHGVYLARFYLDLHQQNAHLFNEHYRRNLVAPLRALVNEQTIELIAAPATWSYLPHITSEHALHAQIEQGVLSIAQRLGRPQGLWMPEFAYREGLEPVAAALGLRYVIAEPPANPSPPPQPFWALERRIVAYPSSDLARVHLDSFELGYRGDPLYRDERDQTGEQAVGLAQNQPYDPYHAFQRTQEHAQHFVDALVAECRHAEPNDVIVIPIDGEQLGRRWFEGSAWFYHVLVLCMTHGGITLTTPARHLQQRRPRGSAKQLSPPREPRSLPSERTAVLRAAEERMAFLARRFESADDLQTRILNQAARELLLAQGFPSEERWRIHLYRFAFLGELLDRPLGESDLGVLEELEERDNPFPTMNYRLYRERN